MWWLLFAVAWVGTGVLTAAVAVRHDHDRVLWFVLGLLFPVAALVALLLGYPRTQSPPGRLAPDLHDALRHSRVAGVLAQRPGLDEPALVEATGLPGDRVAGELRSLRMLGLTQRDRERTWRLTPPAAAAIAADRDEPRA